MADRELAAKLEQRLAKLSFDLEGQPADPAVTPQSSIPEPPPPPPQKQQTPPFRAIPDDELTDMDKLIGQTLQVNSHNVPPTWMDYTPEPFKKTLPILRSGTTDPVKPLKVQLDDDEDAASNRKNDSPLLSPKCTAPVVPIVHHKNVLQHENHKQICTDDYVLQKERDELEAKLAKQRQKKSVPTADTAAAEPARINKPFLDANRSPSIPAAAPPPVLPKTSSLDLDLPPVVPQKMEPQHWINSPRTPPPTPKKPVPSIPMSQASSSPTCSTTSLASTTNDGDELAAKLARRNMIAEGESVEPAKPPKLGIYSEFHEFTRKQIKYFMETFKKFDEDRDNFIDFNELKLMMEKLGEAQTHIALKNMLKLVDEDQDGKVSPREFMLIFRYAATGQLECADVFNNLAASVVDVTKEGVHGAADFFQAKIEEQTKLSKFEEEIRAEQEERKQQEAEKKQRRQQFLANKAVFI